MFDVHEQSMWTSHKGQDSPVSHGHNGHYKYMTQCNRGIYSSQTKSGDDDDSTLTPTGSNSISGDFHGLSLYSCWICGTKGHLSQYCSKTLGRDRHEPDSHMLYPHMTHVAPHDIPHFCSKQLLPQLGDIGLQKEVVRISKVNGQNKYRGPIH